MHSEDPIFTLLLESISEIKAELRHLNESMSSHNEKMQTKLQDHEKRIGSHEHYFKIAGFLVTGGLAGFIGWVAELFGKFGK